MGVGRWEGAQLPRRQLCCRQMGSGSPLVFVIETISVLNQKSEQMITVVISPTKVIVPFKRRHQRTFLSEEITSGRVHFVWPFCIFVFAKW